MQEGIVVPRSPLHKETIYGQIKVDDGFKNIKTAIANLDLIIDKEIRLQLEARLKENDGDVKKTLKALKKNPLVVNDKKVEQVKCFRQECVVKYDITGIRYKDVSYIVDPHIRKIVNDRFEEVNKKDIEFVKSLAERPLFSDRDGKHQIRTVRMFTGLKMNTLAGVRKNEKGETIGYAQTRNNHHVAFYKDEDGKIFESVVSFWDCVKRRRVGLPAIIKDPAEAWDTLIALEHFDGMEDLVNTMPPANSKFVMTLQRNEMVVLGMTDEEWRDAVAANDIRTINRHLYRVWKLSSGDYFFKYHTSTTATIEDGDKEIQQFFRLGVGSLFDLNPRKVMVSILGQLITLTDDKENSML